MEKILGYFLYFVVKAINGTIKFEIKNQSNIQIFENINFIFATWHKNTFSPFYYYRNRKIAMFVADDFGGKILGFAAKKLGYETIIMDNPARSLIKMINKVKNGQNSLMAVDGPSGPYMEIKNGTQLLSQKTGVKTIGLNVIYSFYFSMFFRWDNYRIPVPFSKVTFEFSEGYGGNANWKKLSGKLGD